MLLVSVSRWYPPGSSTLLRSCSPSALLVKAIAVHGRDPSSVPHGHFPVVIYFIYFQGFVWISPLLSNDAQTQPSSPNYCAIHFCSSP